MLVNRRRDARPMAEQESPQGVKARVWWVHQGCSGTASEVVKMCKQKIKKCMRPGHIHCYSVMTSCPAYMNP